MLAVGIRRKKGKCARTFPMENRMPKTVKRYYIILTIAMLSLLWTSNGQAASWSEDWETLTTHIMF